MILDNLIGRNSRSESLFDPGGFFFEEISVRINGFSEDQ